ncbi:unnamed protein product [Trichobilharzia regenti]|nr:unnamed protein product [Trichobilharzia regenti]
MFSSSDMYTNISGGSDFNRQIIKWFNDSWSPSSPLSLHRLVHVSGKKPGEWCGPTSVCTAILHVMAQGSSLDNRLGQIEVYLARDRVIYRQEIMDIARDPENTGSSAILLLIPLMFGKENCINPCYIQSWYCPIPKTMNAAKLDPCCAVGFYCRTRGELSDLIDRLPVLLSINKCAEETSKSSTVKSIVEVLSLEEMDGV